MQSTQEKFKKFKISATPHLLLKDKVLNLITSTKKKKIALEVGKNNGIKMHKVQGTMIRLINGNASLIEVNF